MTTIAASSPPRQHVAADRDRVGGEVLDDALVEALVAAAEQRDRRLGAPARRRSASSSIRPPGVSAITRRSRRRSTGSGVVDRPQRLVHDVDAQHHAGAAAEGRVVDLAAAQRRVVAGVEGPQLVAARERVGTWRWVGTTRTTRETA